MTNFKIQVKGFTYSLACFVPALIMAAAVMLFLASNDYYCDSVNRFRSGDPFGLLAFLGLACGLGYRAREEQFFGSSSFVCGFLFGSSHLLLTLLPKLECTAYQSWFSVQGLLLFLSVFFLLASAICAFAAHDKAMKNLRLTSSLNALTNND